MQNDNNIHLEMNTIDILNQYEAKGMRSQPDVVWSRADKHFVYDDSGKQYIDFTAAIMIANAGHNCPDIKEAIIKWLDTGIYTSYMFPNAAKAQLLKALAEFIPQDYKTALYSTGAEAIEAAIKIARIWGNIHKPASKNLIVSFNNAFHGRTMGAQAVGGIDVLKTWMPNSVATDLVLHVPFPDQFYTKDNSFELFLKTLKQNSLDAYDISAVMIECYQGSVGAFAPIEYMQTLSMWCKQNNILLIIDEVQSGFGRTGKFWAYEHYQMTPDMIVAGKGISSSLPLSAVIAKADVIDLCPTGMLNTTHSGNPLCCIAAYANIQFLKQHQLIDHVAKLGQVLQAYLLDLQQQFPTKIRAIFGKGLVAALHIGHRENNKPDAKLAKHIVDECINAGLLLYNPGGVHASTIKIAPPLVIDEISLLKGCDIIRGVLS